MPITDSPKKIKMVGESITINHTIDGKSVNPQTSKNSSGKLESEKNRKQILPKADPYIWGIYCLILVVAIVELFSASSGEVKGQNVYEPLVRQLVFVALGFFIILGLQRIHYGYISRFAIPFAVVTGALLFYADLWGANINGAQRAIMIGSITIQPPEIAKLAVVVVLAMILGKNQQPFGVSMRGIVWSSIVVAIFAGLTFQNGLTNMIIIMFVSVVMMLIGGIPLKKLFLVFAIYGVLLGMFMFIKKEIQKANEFDAVATEETIEIDQDANTKVDRSELRVGRIGMWLKGTHPQDTMTDYNRQDMLSRMAQAHGGIIGKGPGNSRESSRLPLAFSDYIYSIIIEDTGLIGGLVLMILYLCLIARAGVLAYRFRRAFPAFLIMGCATLIVFQALVHMAIVTGAMPVSGQPLPFISKGGTSVLIMSVAIGIMLSVSRFAEPNDKKENNNSNQDEPLPKELQAENITNYNLEK